MISALGRLAAWWTALSIERPLAFAALTVLVIVLVGVALGILTDALLAGLGINLRERKPAER
jgi:hypothetical protein